MGFENGVQISRSGNGVDIIDWSVIQGDHQGAAKGGKFFLGLYLNLVAPIQANKWMFPNTKQIFYNKAEPFAYVLVFNTAY